jgi:hypothetical protein
MRSSGLVIVSTLRWIGRIAAVEFAGAAVCVAWFGAAAKLALAPEMTLARNVVDLDALSANVRREPSKQPSSETKTLHLDSYALERLEHSYFEIR